MRRGRVALAGSALALVILATLTAAGSDGGVGEGGGGSSGASSAPLACDGGLCATANGSTCAAAPGATGGAAASALIAALGLFSLLRRRRRRWLASALPVLALASPSAARADAPRPVAASTEAPVDVVVRDDVPRRFLSIAANPVSLIIGKASADVVFAPFEQHALVVSPFYTWATTQPIYVFDAHGVASRLPVQRFTGVGTEIGYRFYSGRGGLRGVFAGPSFVVAAMNAKAEDGAVTRFVDYGLALDAGYSTLVGDRVALAAGLGAQYLATSKSIPPQQFDARVFANRGILPRLLVSIGWAF